MSTEYRSVISDYADSAPRLGYTRSNPPHLTHDMLAMVVKEHPEIVDDMRLSADAVSRHITALNFQQLGVLVTTHLIEAAKRELSHDIDMELLRREEAAPVASRHWMRAEGVL